MTEGLLSNATAPTSEGVSESTETSSATPYVASVAEVPADGAASTDQTTSTEWFWADGVKGEGEKPDYLQDSKYKSVAEQAKGYNEVRKLLGSFSGSPENYDFGLNEELSEYEINGESPVIEALVKFGHDHKLSQEGFSELLHGMVGLQKQSEEMEEQQFAEFQKAQLDEIQKEDPQVLNNLMGWLNNFGFSEEEVTGINNWIQTADDVRLLKKLKDKMRIIPVTKPDSSVQDMSGVKTALREKINDKRYLSDPDYRKMVDQEYKNVYGQ